MKKLLYLTSIVSALVVTSCGDVTPESETKMKVSVTAGESFEDELTFTVASENCLNCAWMCVKNEASLPSDTDILSKGKAVFANTEASAKAQNLEDNTTYVIIAAAMDENGNMITSTPVEMTTLEREAQPAVALSAGAAEADTYTFTLTPTDAEICYYKVYPDGATSSADDIVATGTEVSGTESQSITVEDLADGVYFVQAVAVNGEKKSLSNQVLFTINTARPTFTISVYKAAINPDLPTNGCEWIVRFYFYDNLGDYTAIAISLQTSDNGHDYLPAGNYIFDSDATGYKVDKEYSAYDGWWGFVDGYCNVTIENKMYTFDIYLVRDNDDYYFANEAFTLNWTGTVEHMPIP